MPSKYKEKHNHLLLGTSYAMAKTIFQANDGFFNVFTTALIFEQTVQEAAKTEQAFRNPAGLLLFQEELCASGLLTTCILLFPNVMKAYCMNSFLNCAII